MKLKTFPNYITGIILQYGKVAIHLEGQRSENCKIDTLFTIRKTDAKGSDKFLDWIDILNAEVENIAKQYNSKTEHWQDFLEKQPKS